MPIQTEPLDVALPGWPETSGGNKIIQPNVVPAGYYFWGTGAFDDFSPTAPATGRGEGDQICLAVTGPDVQDTVEGFFFEHIYILGGRVGANGAGYQDWVSLDVLAPASVPTSNPGAGNAKKVDIGGVNIILPETNGDWDVDGSTLEFGEKNQNLTPVPNTTNTGGWDWDPNQSPSIIANAGAGAFDLYDFEIVLARQANRYPLIHAGTVTPEAAVKAKKMLPHWKWRFTIFRKEAGTVEVAIRLDAARKETK